MVFRFRTLEIRIGFGVWSFRAPGLGSWRSGFQKLGGDISNVGSK